MTSLYKSRGWILHLGKIATKDIYEASDDYLNIDCEFNNIVVPMFEFPVLSMVVC